MALPPHSFLSVARQRGARPPPHSSENRIFVPSLLNVAECQNAKFESETASRRTGFTGSRMLSRMPWPPHAPPARPADGYTVMSWHWRVDEIGETPGTTLLGAIVLFTIACRFSRNVTLSAAVGVPEPPRAATMLSSWVLIHVAPNAMSLPVVGCFAMRPPVQIGR